MKIKLMIIICVLVSNAMAQTEEEIKTLFGNQKPRIGYFLSPFCQFGKIAGPMAVLPGIGAGIILNNKISFGLSYKFIASENTPDKETDDRLYLDQKYIGLRCEYSLWPESIAHLNFPLEAGMGETELDLKDSYEGNDVSYPQNDAWFA
jgi:hypothetical protein